MTNYTFTAFTRTDLFGDVHVGRHATFVMPAEPTLTVTVKDDDSKMSGDAHRNERGDDRSEQTAAILKDGADIGNGDTMYIEQIWRANGSDGAHYQIAELEQPGFLEDNFTFVGGVPAAGVKLTLTGAFNVRGEGISYKKLSSGEPAPADPNIVEIATGSDDFNILVKALSTAGLVEAVQTSTDITVFAPTDAAFTALAVDLGFAGDTSDEDAVFGFIAEQLTALGGGDPILLLTDILLYHVSPGAKSAADVDAADAIATLLEGATFGSEGTELTDNEPDVANPNIVIPDIAASNGTVQVIDRVLLPIDIPGNEPAPADPNIVEIATGSDDFNILVKALSTAGLVEAVQTSTDITVFAPTDAAFTALAVDLGFAGDTSDEDAVFGFIAEQLTALGGGDPIPLLTDILLYHVSPGAKSAADVDAADAIATLLEGATFGSEGTELTDNEPDVANPNIVIPDIAASNGTVQVIDRVLLPIDIPGNEPVDPPMPAGTLAALVAASGGVFDDDASDFDLLLTAAQVAGLVPALDEATADLTVFAPNDGAFLGLAHALGFEGTDEASGFTYLVEALTLLGGGDPLPLLTEVLTYHVSPGAKDSAAVLGSTSIETLQGGTLGVNGTMLVDAEPDVADPSIIETDLVASNGIAHVIDGVLLPADLLQSDGSGDVDFIIDDDTASTIKVAQDNDFVDGNGDADRIFLGKGDDVGLGGAGSDYINGGGGNDLINGGTGNDVMLGGAGMDTFVFASGDGHDRIVRFEQGADKIDLSAFGFTDFAEVEQYIVERPNGVRIDIDGELVISLHLDGATLNVSDFIL